ncbi:hypothetical protein BDZ94DRAFT_1255456 [Collybia nuda]|uniref:C2H2-type domain-containing protein n=1 Tax=Collybia nuda TaxID=64659 RepID=A0A9P5YA26_9AGAR|nr:hypothetical protein BDZ94DRAFT_1255456 [Collybia nuda]
MTITWPCSTCLKVFSRKGDLSRHNNLHTGIKPHRCEDCGKQFSQFSGLKTHRNVHTKVKPFKCGMDDCSAAFGDPSSCARHRKETHRTLGAFRCPVRNCKSSIKRRSAFKGHLRKHKIDPDSVDIDAMAPPLLPRSSVPRRKSINQATTEVDFGTFDDTIPNIAFPTVNPHTYHAPQLTAPSYYYPFSDLPDNTSIGGSHVDNPWYSQNSMIQQSEVPGIFQETEQLYTINSPSTPPILDFSLSPSPSPSRNDSVHTPVGPAPAHQANFFIVSPSTPSRSPLPQSTQLSYFAEPMFTARKNVQWNHEFSVFGNPMLIR